MAKDIQRVADLFDGKQQYRTPRYQRRYVWQETNWKALWEDIKKIQHQLEIGEEDKDHFTGTIVTQPDEDESALDKYEIIDGQQRLATFQVIFCVIRDIAASPEYADSGLESKIKGIIELPEYDVKRERSRIARISEHKNSNAEDEFSLYSLVLKGRDKDTFESLVKNEELDLNNVIADAYSYFDKEIRAYLEEEGLSKLQNLMDALAYNFHVVQVRIEPNDDPQQIFGSINGTGRILDEFDLLRNDLFLRVNNKEDQENWYETYWCDFDEDKFWAKDGRLDEFLRFFLTAKLGPMDFRKKRLFHDVYKGQYHVKLQTSLEIENQNDPKFVKTEFEELAKYAKTYREMENPTTDIGRRRQFYKDLNLIFEDLDLKNLPPFILYVKNELDLDDNERDQVYKILESYTLRCQLRHGISEDKTTYIKIDNLFAEMAAGKIKKPRIAEVFAEYLSDANKAGRSWLGNQAILHSLRKVGNQMDSLSRSLRRPISEMLRYIFYRIECLKREETDADTKPVGLSFKDFFSRYILIKPLHRSRDSKTAYSIGNITFCAEHLSAYFSFSDKKDILLETPNSDLILNEEIEEYSEWRDSQIRERENKLLACLYEIWPPAENFFPKMLIDQTPASEIKTTNGDVIQSKTGPKTEPRWISMIQLEEYQPIKFVTYAGSQEFSGVKTGGGRVIGIGHDSNQTLRKPNMLFACSAAAWPEVEPYIEILDYVRKEKLQPTLNQSEYLDINNHLLESVQQAQVQVIPVTRYGHMFQGTIEAFDEDAIYMQMREQMVIVYRDGIYEFAIEELHQGVVTYFNGNRGFGFIKSFEHESVYVHITDVLDRNISELQPNQQVTFDLNHTTKGEGLSAINVQLIEN